MSPTAFLGGKRTLDVDRARAALEKHVGAHLGVDTEQAARAVVEAAWDAVAQLARETAEEAGWDPAEVTVYGFGGNGPLFVTAVADRLGAPSARLFRLGSVLLRLWLVDLRRRPRVRVSGTRRRGGAHRRPSDRGGIPRPARGGVRLPLRHARMGDPVGHWVGAR